MSKETLAWHFVNGNTLRDGTPLPENGVTLKFPGEIELCASGFHASVNLRDALQYAPGTTLCRVRISGDVIHSDDKLVATERTILWRIDAENMLRQFARETALSVAHLWDTPDVVREYLTTGNEDLRIKANAAARAAAGAGAAYAAASAAYAAANAAANAAYAARAAANAAAYAVDAAYATTRTAQNLRLTEMAEAENLKQNAKG